MRRHLCAAAAILALATAGAGARQRPVFRSSAGVVSVHATVFDSAGQLVTTLGRDDFEVLDDGRPASITTFSSDPQPLTLLVLFDTSPSMTPHLARIREAALACVNSLGAGDRARIGSFSDEIAISPHLTADKAVLTRVVREELWPGISTPLWTAMYMGLQQLGREHGRRVLLVLTDGVNRPWWRLHGHSQTDVLDLARRDDWMVYAVGLQAAGLSGDIANVVQETGGGRFVVPDSADLTRAYERIMGELHHQYLIGIPLERADGKVHRLRVRSKVPGLRVRARTSYFAGGDTTRPEPGGVAVARPAVPPTQADRPALASPSGPGAPVDVLLMLDFSGSVFGAHYRFGHVSVASNEGSIRGDLIAFTGETAPDDRYLQALDRAGRALLSGLGTGAHLRMASFGERIVVANAPVRVPSDVRSALKQIWQMDGPSPIWDALDEAIATAGPENTATRSVVVLVTDGHASASVKGFEEVRASAGKSRTTIYVIHRNETPPTETGPPPPADFNAVAALRDLATSSGGLLVSFRDDSSLTAAMTRVAEDFSRRRR